MPFDEELHSDEEGEYEDEESDEEHDEHRKVVCHKGGTPLIAAVRRQDDDFVRYLLENGADASILDPRGESVWWALFFERLYFQDGSCRAALGIANKLCEYPHALRVINAGPTPPLWRAIRTIRFTRSTREYQEAQR